MGGSIIQWLNNYSKALIFHLIIQKRNLGTNFGSITAPTIQEGPITRCLFACFESFVELYAYYINFKIIIR